MTPFLLPDGPVQVAFSGGRTSAYLLHRLLEANGGLPERAVVSFQNTGREMPETLDFVVEVAARWNVRIVWLEYRPEAPFFEIVNHNSASRNGEPFEALIHRKRYLPNVAARFCTIELKVRTAKRYLMRLGWRHWTNAVGIRADEPHRLNKPAGEAPAKADPRPHPGRHGLFAGPHPDRGAEGASVDDQGRSGRRPAPGARRGSRPDAGPAGVLGRADRSTE